MFSIVKLWIFLIINFCFAFKYSILVQVTKESTGSTDLSKEINSDNLLLFSTLDGTLTAVEQKDGKIRWKHKDEPAVKVPVDTKQAINPIILPDPKDGSLYLLGGTEAHSLKKLPFTIPELVASAPCRSSDGILYTGKKTDQWFLVEPRSGQREPVLGWDSNAPNSNTCPLPPGSAVFIGRTQYEILMMELDHEMKRKWNVTFFGYAAEPMSADMRMNYEMVHFSASSTGILMTMDRISGKIVWKVDLGSPVVASYMLTPTGLITVPFTSVAHQTMKMLEKTNPLSTKLRLYPTLYIGEHVHGLYALPSLVDQSTVTITASQTSPLLLEGPSTANEEKRPNFLLSGQNIRLLPDQLSHLNEPSLIQNIFMDKNAIIYLGHYNVPDFSPVQLQIAGRRYDEEKFLKPSLIDLENESHIDEATNQNTVKIPTDADENFEHLENNIKHSTHTHLVKLYWLSKNWLNRQENKGLKLALIIVVGCMISMFWYFKAQVRDIQQMSQGSTGSVHSQNGMVTAYLEDLDNGRMRVGKITFEPDIILGRGCEGTFVYKGEFEGRSVAVKRLLPECFSLADREVSLLKESDAHPHVIRYHCTERDRQFRYIALELCVATLFDYVTNPKQTAEVLPPISEMDILKQATSGIAHLHSLDIVHRDIKPQNVLLWVGRGGLEVRAMISDFGLCKKLQIGRASFSRRSGVTGTEGWIAPEMLLGNFKTTTSVDMFSLGCVFYFVLSNGKHPFGEPLRRQANILSNLFELNDLQGSQNVQELAKSLIRSLINSTPSERPSAAAVLIHPLFWNRAALLTFLQDVSDRVEKTDLSDKALRNLEYAANDVIRNDWRMHVSDAVAEDLRRFRTYKGESVRDLLRALRNKKHHYHELPIKAQLELGEIPDSFVDYWTSRFPLLVLHTWLAMQCIKNEPAFKRYYDQTYSFQTLHQADEDTILEQAQFALNEEMYKRNSPKVYNKNNKTKKLVDAQPQTLLNVDKNMNKNLNYDWRSRAHPQQSTYEQTDISRKKTMHPRSKKNTRSKISSAINDFTPTWKLSPD